MTAPTLSAFRTRFPEFTVDVIADVVMADLLDEAHELHRQVRACDPVPGGPPGVPVEGGAPGGAGGPGRRWWWSLSV